MCVCVSHAYIHTFCSKSLKAYGQCACICTCVTCMYVHTYINFAYVLYINIASFFPSRKRLWTLYVSMDIVSYTYIHTNIHKFCSLSSPSPERVREWEDASQKAWLSLHLSEVTTINIYTRGRTDRVSGRKSHILARKWKADMCACM